MTNPTIILSLAFGKEYVKQQKRLIQSIPTGYDQQHWTEEYPPGSRTHLQSLYGFKPHAIQWALDRGYKNIIWLDTACIVTGDMSYWDQFKIPVIAARDENKLERHISAEAAEYFGPINPDWHLLGGSVYVWDFNQPITSFIFNEWMSAEKNGLFGDASQRGPHRHDEAVLACCMYRSGVEPMSCGEMRYNTKMEDTIIDKKHFK